MKRVKWLLLVSMAALAIQLNANELNYKDILNIRSKAQSVASMKPTQDSEHYTYVKRADSVQQIVKEAYADKNISEVLFTAPTNEYRIGGYSIAAGGAILIEKGKSSPIYRHSYTTGYDLYCDGELAEIFSDEGVARDATLSPDGSWLAYSSENNLYLYGVKSGEYRAITTDGEWNEIINGTCDWVYEEELGFTRAYWFSPDGRHIAYLRFDESEVPLFEMMRFDEELYNKSYSFKYPKAGDANATVELYLYDIEANNTAKIDVGRETNQYIPHVGFTPRGELFYHRLNRQQNHFEMVLVDANGSQRVVYEEKSPTYIERVGASTVTFIDGDKFIVSEETTTGYMHLYLHSLRKGRVGAITKGEWEVTQLLGVEGGTLYYVSTEGSPLERAIYSVGLDGRRKRKLSGESGYYTAQATPDMSYYVAQYQTINEPVVAAIYNRKGELVRELYDNEAMRDAILDAQLPEREPFEIKMDGGYTLNGYMQRPADFDETKSYPLLITQYSGPGSQSVSNRFSVDWEDAMPSHGYIVVCVDGRGTGCRGEAFKKCTYGDLGRREALDQIEVARRFSELQYVDAERIGIYGWSYGGFTSLNAALHGGELFKMSIAVAPVTSWRYYDTIYTELYNGLPQDNAEGYDYNSPLNHAEKLSERTRLLLIHGTADDNVHLQNTIEMTRALNRAGKSYDMMIYPDQNHSMRPDDGTNVREKMIRYTIENL